MGTGKSRPTPAPAPKSESVSGAKKWVKALRPIPKTEKECHSLTSLSEVSSGIDTSGPAATNGLYMSSEFMRTKCEMKAAYYERGGNSSTLVVGNVPLPQPKENEITVRVLAAAVNPYDIKLRSNHFPGNKPFKVVGTDFSGVVVDISHCSDSIYDVGDNVFGNCVHSQYGSTAEFVCVDQNHVALSPKRARPPYFTEAEIASLPTVGLTVLEAFEPFVLDCEAQAQAQAQAQARARGKIPGQVRASGPAPVPVPVPMPVHVPISFSSSKETGGEDDDTVSEAGTDLGYGDQESSSVRISQSQSLVSSMPGTVICMPKTAGKTCLVQGGGGGLGNIAIQYAKHVLCMRVFTTCSSRNAKFCQKLGADVIIDYVHNPTFLETDERLAGGVDVIFDSFSWLYRNRTFQSPLPALKPSGWYIDVASSPHSLAQAAAVGMVDPLRLHIPEESYAYRMQTGCFSLFNSCTNIATTLVEQSAGVFTQVGRAIATSTAATHNDGDSESDDDYTEPFSHRTTSAAGPVMPPSDWSLLGKCKELSSCYGTHRQYTLFRSVTPSAKHLRHLARLTRSGLVLPVVSRSHVFPFTTDGIRRAHDTVETGHCRGKVVIAVSCFAGIRGGGLGSGVGTGTVLWEETKAT